MGEEGKARADLNRQAIAWLVSLDVGTADEQAFDAWRDEDPRHAAAFAQVAAVWRRTADPRISVLLDPSAESTPTSEAEPDNAQPRTWSRRAVAGGTFAALLGLGGSFLAWPRRTYAMTAVGERRTLRLPDGSHAMLNTDTRVSWHFADARDFWIERGEAALLVRQAGRPFHLHSDAIDARLDSGKLNIRVEQDSGKLLVLAGQATVSRTGTSAQTIPAGSALSVSDGAVQIAPLSVDAIGEATAWQNGRIVFNGMPLDRAIGEFNRYLPDKIVLQSPDLAATRLGGEFQTDDPDAFLLALRDGFDIDHRRQDNQIVLFKGR